MIGLTWTGWDGSVWDFRNGPVFITNGGMSGLSHTAYDVFTRDTAERDGQILTGWRAQAREVLLPVRIGSSSKSASEWLSIERAFWKTMRPGKYGTLTATAPDGSRRTLSLRFVDDGTASYDKDPSRLGATNIALKMMADDPWWYGEKFGKEFSHAPDGTNFFGGAKGKATPFIIGKRNTLDAATVTNEGDIPVYPTYEMEGPISEFSITIDGYPLAGSIDVQAGELLRIDTSPVKQIATLIDADGNSSNVTRQLTAVNFRPVPEGQALKLDISMTGTGTFRLIGYPAFYRGW